MDQRISLIPPPLTQSRMSEDWGGKTEEVVILSEEKGPGITRSLNLSIRAKRSEWTFSQRTFPLVKRKDNLF